MATKDDIFSSLLGMAENEDAKNASAETRKRVSTLESRVDNHRAALKQVNDLLKEIISRIQKLEVNPEDEQ